MTSQLEFDLDDGKRRPVRPRVAAALRASPALIETFGNRIVRWAPVWMPSILVLQVALFGLRPALAERTRVDGADAVVRGRELVLNTEATALEINRQMLSDPIYRQRVRKSVTSAGTAPLLLDDPARSEAPRRRDP